MDDDDLTLIVAFGIGAVGIICMIVSFVIANVLIRYRPQYPLSALLVLSGFPFPLMLDLVVYAHSGGDEDILSWFVGLSLVDIATSAVFYVLGLLTAWLVLRKRIHKTDPKAFE